MVERAGAAGLRTRLRPLRFVLDPALAGLSGVLLAFAAPPSPAGALAWIGLVPLLFVVRRSRPLASFLYALLAGCIYYSLAFQWTAAFHKFALPFVVAVSATLFVALPLLCIRPFLRRGSLALLAAPSLWVLFEYVKQNWLLQFPFGILGYTQYSWTRVIQVADLGGVALVSWLIILVNTSLFLVIDRLLVSRHEPARIRTAVISALAASAALGASLSYGTAAVAGLRVDQEPRLKVGYAQTFFRPGRTDRDGSESLRQIEAFVRDFRGLGVQLVLFPELTFDTALTYEKGIFLRGNAATLNRVSALARQSGMNLLFGSLELRERGGGVRTYNTMQMFTPDGTLSDLYRKSILVPFGETNPFAAVFPGFSDYLRGTTASIQLDRGDTPHLFSVAGSNGASLKFGVLICFESCFGQLGRGYARDGADFLVSATDDSWSFSSTAMYQHAVMSIFRAVETRTPVLRVSNGGLSCYVDERGRYATSLPLFSVGAMTSRLYLLHAKPATLYVRAGDWLIPLSIVLLLAALGILLRAHKERGGVTPTSRGSP